MSSIKLSECSFINIWALSEFVGQPIQNKYKLDILKNIIPTCK